MSSNPFHKLNLSRNPFGSLSADEWADVAIIPDVVAQAAASNAHLLFLGAKGRGKSTLLRALSTQIGYAQHSAYERIPNGNFRFQSDISTLAVFALDEAQRLAPHCWLMLMRRARQNKLRLIIGSHWNHAPFLRLAGLDVRVFHVAKLTTAQHVAQVLQARIAYFSLDASAPQLQFSEDAIAWLWAHFKDNLRAQGNFLYEVIQSRDDMAIITAADLDALWR